MTRLRWRGRGHLSCLMVGRCIDGAVERLLWLLVIVRKQSGLYADQCLMLFLR